MSSIEEGKQKVLVSWSLIGGIVFATAAVSATYWNVSHNDQKHDEQYQILLEKIAATNNRIDKKTARNEEEIDELKEEIKKLKGE